MRPFLAVCARADAVKPKSRVAQSAQKLLLKYFKKARLVKWNSGTLLFFMQVPIFYNPERHGPDSHATISLRRIAQISGYTHTILNLSR